MMSTRAGESVSVMSLQVGHSLNSCAFGRTESLKYNFTYFQRLHLLRPLLHVSVSSLFPASQSFVVYIIFCSGSNTNFLCPDSRTTGGNSNGAACVIPFKYKGVEYTGCTTIDYKNEGRWCATVYNYDTNNKWGKCICSVDVVPGR